MLVNVVKSNRIDKKFMAIFSNGKKVHFGSKLGETFLDHLNLIKRFNYLKRHGALESWEDPFKPSTLSAYLSWGNHYTLSENIHEFNKVFFRW